MVPFERVEGAEIDLGVESPPHETERLFEFASLRLADFDADGSLDLWLLSVGEERRNHLFVRRGHGYADVTRETGLDALRGNTYTVLLDVDNDGLEDAVSSGLVGEEERGDLGEGTGAGYALLWRNRGGKRFEFRRLSVHVVPQPIHTATALDADGDGRLDLAMIGVDRLLLRNVARTGHSFLAVRPRDGAREALGALVRVKLSNGRTHVRRYGSAASSTYSQSLPPLYFGVPAGATVGSAHRRVARDDPGGALRPAGAGQRDRAGEGVTPPGPHSSSSPR